MCRKLISTLIWISSVASFIWSKHIWSCSFYFKIGTDIRNSNDGGNKIQPEPCLMHRCAWKSVSVVDFSNRQKIWCIFTDWALNFIWHHLRREKQAICFVITAICREKIYRYSCDSFSNYDARRWFAECRWPDHADIHTPPNFMNLKIQVIDFMNIS